MEALVTDRLLLEPLCAGHAEAMFAVLRDPALYHYLDYPPPPSVAHLRRVYARLAARQSPDGSQAWLNWMIVPHGQAPVGYVQATVLPHHAAWIAYVLARSQWGRGIATEATGAVLRHLRSDYGVERCLATVEAANHRSIRVLERLGFRAASPQQAAAHALADSERLFISNIDDTPGAPSVPRAY